MMKVNKIFTVLTAAFLLAEILVFTGCKSKNTKKEAISTEISDTNNGSERQGDVLLKYDEYDNNLKTIEISDFYKPNGYLIDTVYIKDTNSFAITLDGHKEFFSEDTIVKLIALNSRKALILLPPSRCIETKGPVYAVIDASALSPIPLEDFISPDFNGTYHQSEYERFSILDSHSWYGIFSPAKELLDTNDTFGIFNFMSQNKGDTHFTFTNKKGTLSGDYDISYDGDSYILEIKIFDNQNNYYDDSTDATTYKYHIRLFMNKAYVSLADHYAITQIDLFYKMDFSSLDKLKNYEFTDTFNNSCNYFFDKYYCTVPCSQFLFSNPKNKDDYQKTFIKFGIYINSDNYIKDFEDYWHPIMLQYATSECPVYNFVYDKIKNIYPVTTITKDNYYSANVITNSQQLKLEDALADYDTLKKFYYKETELYPYGYIFNPSDDSKDVNIYKNPDVKSEVVFKENFFYANISAIGKKAKINGIESHWVEIVLPRFLWKGDDPEYGWVFGTNVNFDEKYKYTTNFSWSLTGNKPNVHDFDFKPLELSTERIDPIFSTKDLYDINESEHSSYHRYLLSKDTTLEGNLEFIKSGVNAHIRFPEDEIINSLYLEDIVNSNQQQSRSLYPVFINDADNLIVRKNDPIVKSELNGFSIKKDSKSSSSQIFEYPYNYIHDNINYDSIKNKATLYEFENGKRIIMVYHSYVDSEYKIHDGITLIDDSKTSENKIITVWHSGTFDVISQTRAKVILIDDEPKIIVKKLNGTLKFEEKCNYDYIIILENEKKSLSESHNSSDNMNRLNPIFIQIAE